MVVVRQYHEDRYPYYSFWQERKVYSEDDQARFYVYLGNPIRRPIGHHWVYVYNEDRGENRRGGVPGSPVVVPIASAW